MNNEAVFAVILAAAGKSSRFGGETEVKKPYAFLADQPVWLHSADAFFRRDDVRQLIVVVSPDDYLWFLEYYAAPINRMLVQVVAGGAERVDSVRNALAAVDETIDFVAVHDAARPCVTDQEIDAVFEAAKCRAAAMLANPVLGTIKRVRDGRIEATVPRTDLWEAQTPQVFRREILVDAYARKIEGIPTDDAELVEKTGCPVFIVPTERWNLKITTPTDLRLAEMILSGKNVKNS